MSDECQVCSGDETEVWTGHTPTHRQRETHTQAKRKQRHKEKGRQTANYAIM